MKYFHHTSRYFTLGLMLALLSGIMLSGLPRTAQADDRSARPREFLDSRYHHDRYYPVLGQFIGALPRDHRVVVHGGARFYFSGGVWYRPQGPRFAIVLPPVGLFVPFLPPYYATIWLHGVPYYYANDVYYAHRGDGYLIAGDWGMLLNAPHREGSNLAML